MYAALSFGKLRTLRRKTLGNVEVKSHPKGAGCVEWVDLTLPMGYNHQ